LTGLRQKIIKRQVLTTVEVLAKPLVAKNKTHLVTGYVHKPYPAKYASLARFAGFEGCLLIRGIEGGVIPSLRQQGLIYRYDNLGEEQPVEITPESLGIEQALRSVPLPEDDSLRTGSDEVARIKNVSIAAAAAATTGKRALEGEPGPAYDSLVYSCSLILWHAGASNSITSAAERVRQVLDSGLALQRIG
jgi:anthranilate phosphoribosyltransferase